MDNKYELIFTILNRGFSDVAMDSARASGAKGGTIITARGTGAKEMERLFGITVSQEKEIILILSVKETRNAIMTSICNAVGLNTQGKGITFSLPVDEVYGVSLGINNAAEGGKTEEATDESKQNTEPTEAKDTAESDTTDKPAETAE